MFRSAYRHASGFLITLMCTLLAFELSLLPYLSTFGPLVLALVVGTVVSALVSRAGELPSYTKTGVGFAAKTLLRVGIVFLGVRLNFVLIAELGPKLVLANVAVIALGLTSIEWLGRKLGLSTSLRRTLAVGSSICGASAIAAAIPVLNSKDEEAGVSIGVISLLGTLAVIAYLALAGVLEPSHILYGSFVGATLQEVAQVVAAGYSFSPEAGDIALVVKLMRVAMLAPVLILLNMMNRSSGEVEQGKRPPLVPWFLVGFTALGIINSLGVIPETLSAALVKLSLWLTALAMAAIGLGINLGTFGKLGTKAVWVSATGFALMVIFMLPYGWFFLS